MRLLLACVATLLIVGCGHEPPNPSGGPPPSVNVPISDIALPITADADEVRQTLEAMLKSKPLVQGSTGNLDASLFLEKTTLKQSLVDVVTTPFRAAGCRIDNVPRTVTRAVKVGHQAIACLNPFSKSCYKDVFKTVTDTVYDEVKTCWPEQQKVITSQLQTVSQLSDLMTPAHVNLRYLVELQSLDWSYVGQTIDLRPTIKIRMDADIDQKLITTDVKAKGALECAVSLALDTKANVGLSSENGTIVPDIRIKDFNIDPQRFCIPGAVQSSKVLAALDPIGSAVTGTVNKGLKLALLAILNKLIEQREGALNVTSRVAQAATTALEPLEIPNVGWLLLHPKSVAFSQLIGAVDNGKPVLQLLTALRAQPELRFGGPKPDADTMPIQVALGASGDDFHVAPEATLPLTVLRDSVRSGIDRLFASRGVSLKQTTYVLDVYRSNDRLVILLTFPKTRRFLKKPVRVFASVKIGVDMLNKVIVFRDAQIDVANAEALKDATNADVANGFPSLLTTKIILPLPTALAQTIDSLAHFKKGIPDVGTISVELKSIGIGSFWLDDAGLHLTMLATGKSSFAASGFGPKSKAANPATIAATPVAPPAPPPPDLTARQKQSIDDFQQRWTDRHAVH